MTGVCMILCCMSSLVLCFFFFFFKQKTAYEMRISDWSSDVCSSDLHRCFGSGSLSIFYTLHGLYQACERLTLQILLIHLQSNASSHQMMKIGRASCRERVCQYV